MNMGEDQESGKALPKPGKGNGQRWWWYALVPALLFLPVALLFVPKLGLQYDESLFAWPLFRRDTAAASLHLGRTQIPLMLMSYLGDLKAWLYWPVLKFFGSSVYSMRVPVVLLTALNLMLWFRILARLHSVGAALFATLLLATESTFILTSTFDWGPVVLQHLLFACAVFAAGRFLETNDPRWVAGAGLCTGLALWDKALAIWIVSGLCAAVAVMYPRIARRWLNRRVLLITVISVCVGAGPLVLYNVKHRLSTVQQNAHSDANRIGEKVALLKDGLRGRILDGYFLSPVHSHVVPEPSGPVDRTARWINHAVPGSDCNWFLFVLGASLIGLLLPAAQAVRRLGLCLLLAAVIAWLEMIVVKNAGGSAHHIVLLWPIPHFIVGLVLAELAKSNAVAQWVVSGVVGAGVVGNAVNTTHYLAEFETRGISAMWSRATLALPARLQNTWTVGAVDWGFMAPFDVLTRGRHRTMEISPDTFTPEGAVAYGDPVEVGKRVRSAVFLQWDGHGEIDPLRYRLLMAYARREKLRRVDLGRIYDPQKRPVVELFRFAGEDEAVSGAELNPDMEGLLDDRAKAVRYAGRWTATEQFSRALHGTLQYTEERGAAAELEISGSHLVFVFTKAPNRGKASVKVDGREVAQVDLYAPEIEWQSVYEVKVKPGRHVVRWEATGEAVPASTGRFIDLDGVLVLP